MATNKKPRCKSQNYNCGKICISGKKTCWVDGLTGQSISIADNLIKLINSGTDSTINLNRPKNYKINKKSKEIVDNLEKIISSVESEEKEPKDLKTQENFEKRSQKAVESIKEEPLNSSHIGNPVSGGISNPNNDEFQSAQKEVFKDLDDNDKFDVNSVNLNDLETYYEGAMRRVEESSEELIKKYDKDLKLFESDIVLFRQLVSNKEFSDLANLLEKEGQTEEHKKLGERISKETEEQKMNLFKRKLERDNIPDEDKTDNSTKIISGIGDFQDLENEKGNYRQDGSFTAENVGKSPLGYPDDEVLEEFDNWVSNNV